MPEPFSSNGNMKNITAEVREYIEKRIQLLTLIITEQVSHIIAESFQRMLGMFILSFALFFLWFAVGFLLADVIGSLSAGFAIASVPLFIIGFIFMRSKSKSVTEKIQAQLISKILNNLEKEKEKEEKLKKIGGEKVEQS